MTHLWNIVEVPNTTSTMNDCRALVSPGAVTAVIAEVQTAGRGRRGNEWTSPAGGLYTTIGWVIDAPAHHFIGLSLVVGLSLVQSLDLASFGFALKWPNDLVHRETRAKLGGILIELNEKEGKTAVLVGIGLNVAPIEVPMAISLAHVGYDLQSPRAVFDRFAQPLSRDVYRQSTEGFAPFRAQWMDHSVHRGRDVSIDDGSMITTGHFEGVGDEGALVIMTDKGQRRFPAGHVVEW